MASKIRVGHGYDVHGFGTGDHLILGGVTIPYPQSFKAHSDGDVLIHALCDALLGAAGLGDIGRHFADTDPQYKNADSRTLLRHVMALLSQRNWQLANADITLVAQAPKMAPYIDEMKHNLAEDINAGVGQVNIKATTTEQLGFEGRKEGVACHAVVLIERADA